VGTVQTALLIGLHQFSRLLMAIKQAVFFDRDGVINEEVNYLANPDQLKLIAGAGAAISQLNALGIPVVVVTNQAGVARGYFTESDIRLVHERLIDLLSEQGAKVDKIYYCPHHPFAGTTSYTQFCNCRKPEPGMLYKAAADLNLDLGSCYLIGDKASDIIAGQRVGCSTILVKTGHGKKEHETWNNPSEPKYVASSILEAVQWIIEDGIGCN
jgi:D-glycero-D-manno-heptose 1,7-bisphosphate phosphatase